MAERRVGSEAISGRQSWVIPEALKESQKRRIPMEPVLELNWGESKLRFEEFKDCYEGADFGEVSREVYKRHADYCAEALSAASQYESKYRVIQFRHPWPKHYYTFKVVKMD